MSEGSLFKVYDAEAAARKEAIIVVLKAGIAGAFVHVTKEDDIVESKQVKNLDELNNTIFRLSELYGIKNIKFQAGVRFYNRKFVRDFEEATLARYAVNKFNISEV